MPVSRRNAIKQLFLVSAGLALLPACLHHAPPATVKVKNISLDGDDEAALAALAETLIPKTDTPGAKELNAHLWAIKMIDDCSPKEKREKWQAGLKGFHEACKKEHGNRFDKCTPEQRAAFLTLLEGITAPKDDVINFYTTTKSLIIDGYTNSEFYLTKVQVYELVPGRFHGSVPVTKA